MASLVTISASNQNGAKFLQIAEMLRKVKGLMEEHDGMRAQLIGASADEMAAQCGFGSAAEAQAFSDRYTPVLSALDAAAVTDFVDTVIRA